MHPDPEDVSNERWLAMTAGQNLYHFLAFYSTTAYGGYGAHYWNVVPYDGRNAAELARMTAKLFPGLVHGVCRIEVSEGSGFILCDAVGNTTLTEGVDPFVDPGCVCDLKWALTLAVARVAYDQENPK